MSLNISSYAGTMTGYAEASRESNRFGINKNSAQYKAAARDNLSDIIANEMTMSPEERLVYETFGGRDLVLKNLMSQYDSDGNYVGVSGIAGIDTTGMSLSEWHQIIDVSDKYRDMMYESVKSEFLSGNGKANGYITTRSSVYEAYQKATPIDDRLKGSWTLQQYENVYWQAMCSAVRAVNPDWQAGQPFDTSIINNLSREDIEACIQQSGSTFSYQRIDYSV